jgi:hypothetical protein
MALIVGHNGPSRYSETIANRTPASGGSLGGPKKAGIFGGMVGWPHGNIPASVFYRAPQRIPSIRFSLANTTRSPVQVNRNGYSASHNGLLG